MSLRDYEAIVLTNEETWDYIVENCRFGWDWEIKLKPKEIRLPKSNSKIRFLNMENLTLKDLQMFTCASQNSTIILDLDYEAYEYKAGLEGIGYLTSRLRKVSDCYTRLVIV